MGKSTVSRDLTAKVCGNYISIDQLLADNNLDYIPEGEESIPLAHFLHVNKIATPQIKEYLEQGVPVVIDGNFYHKEALSNIANTFTVPTLIFTLKATVETCIRRDSERTIPHGKFAAMAVHALVSRFDAGIVIDMERLDSIQTLEKITQHLP